MVSNEKIVNCHVVYLVKIYDFASGQFFIWACLQDLKNKF
jgi:hypothetical protein